MSLSLGDLLRLARFTVTSPREGARALMAMGLPMEARWIALVLTAVGAALVTFIGLTLLPQDVRNLIGDDLPSPLFSAGLQVGLLAVSAGLIYRIGVWRGGRGSFPDAVLLVAWLQFILLCLEVIQLVAQLILPPFADLLGVVGIVLFFWLLTHFVAELHGFTSTVAVLGGILLTLFGMAFVLAAILMPFLGG
ncbi:YIP1 family protein [Cereibacter azotoformans]|uniref:Yip1-like protein n=2 Tax=Cereibacter TaxID=1653176 RepID=A0A2T5KBU3_9RHOB|nr:Yip1 family protein [Cereibacter azotoformans]AXQ94233.1 YIP1 family protein [Cereibacter sphaeroides]MBO4167955.1 YIP1 family protein [Cereibacter azotoformans]PTR19887.1 Yip1-like protein [Cereibacter azotoformans]UIJ29774.1 YIP1 family protein [Cereibacter azotoformans]ULB10461.1 YIP1 family protein [Cereibacter azotoformans]